MEPKWQDCFLLCTLLAYTTVKTQTQPVRVLNTIRQAAVHELTKDTSVLFCVHPAVDQQPSKVFTGWHHGVKREQSSRGCRMPVREDADVET